MVAATNACGSHRSLSSTASNALAFKTLGQVYESYKSVRKSGWSDTTIEDYEKKWAYVEAFGLARKKVNAVREDDVIELQTFVLGVVQANSPVDPDGKPIRNGQASAVAVLRLVKILFNSLVRRGAVTSNPLGEMVEAGLFRKNEPRSRMIKAKDLPIVWHWLHHEAHPAVRDYILCALLLGLRSSVAGSLRWDNLVEQDGKWIYIMRADQKGNKRRQEIPIPVPTYLADIVIKPRLASPTKHATWIIESPKRRGHPMKSIRGSMSALESKTKIKLSMHDLRRTIATFAHKATDPLTARRILSHSVMAAIDRQATSAGYIIQTIDDLRDGMNKTVDYILKIIDDAKKSPSV